MTNVDFEENSARPTYRTQKKKLLLAGFPPSLGLIVRTSDYLLCRINRVNGKELLLCKLINVRILLGDKPPTTEADLETKTGKEEPCALEERTLNSLTLLIGVQRNGQSPRATTKCLIDNLLYLSSQTQQIIY